MKQRVRFSLSFYDPNKSDYQFFYPSMNEIIFQMLNIDYSNDYKIRFKELVGIKRNGKILYLKDVPKKRIGISEFQVPGFIRSAYRIFEKKKDAYDFFYETKNVRLYIVYSCTKRNFIFYKFPSLSLLYG